MKNKITVAQYIKKFADKKCVRAMQLFEEYRKFMSKQQNKTLATLEDCGDEDSVFDKNDY